MRQHLALVVDDSPLSRVVIRRHLEAAGFRVNEAADGAEGAVAVLREVPSLVVTDLEMPVMDGFQLARLIKTDPATRDVKIIILTGHTEAKSRFWGLQTGADAYVTKDDLEQKLMPVVEGLVADVLPPSASPGNAPQGPLEVLARVAQHLDEGLMEATLSNQILRIGMNRRGFAEACREVLGLFSRLAHAHLLALCLLDEGRLKIFLHRSSACRSSLRLSRIKNLAAERLEVSLDDLESISIEGDSDGAGAAIDLSTGIPINLSLVTARAFVVVWPVDAEKFAAEARALLEKSAPQVSLVFENVVLAERLWRMSTHDELTGLLNHRAIRDRFFEEYDRAHRHSVPFAIVVCDIDHFKLVNDRHGHLVGDAVLKAFAERLKLRLRTSDVIGRYGGEEFLLLLPHTDLASACAVAEEICSNLSRGPIEAAKLENPMLVTASFGVASSAEISGADGAESLIALADRRLYQAKDVGRACVKPG